MEKRFYIKAFRRSDDGFENPCGSDWGMIISDLKSLKGVKKRIQECWWRKDTEFLEVYSMTSYLSDTDLFIERIYDIKNRMSF